MVSCSVWQLLHVSERGYSHMRDSVMMEEGKTLTCIVCVLGLFCVRTRTLLSLYLSSTGVCIVNV